MALQSLARKHGLTLNILVQGAWALLELGIAARRISFTATSSPDGQGY